MDLQGFQPCFYCFEYNKVATDYPINNAMYNREKFTPRCFLHWQYECSKCGKMTHFNGIAWCSDCKEFTCLFCADEKMVRKEFLIYDYYYEIPCHKCNNLNSALDFAEYNGEHPFQIGNLQPEEEIVVWMPIYKKEIEPQEFPHKASGFERVCSLGRPVDFKKLDSLEEYDPKSVWDALAPSWAPVFGIGGDFHHKNLILPHVFKMINAQQDERILDVACGEGNVARNLAKSGAKITGIDVSKMVDFAIEREKKDKLGITYLKLYAEELMSKFGSNSFDKVVCNMALMDIEDCKTTIENISNVLKEKGIFVFSITHPAYAWPACTTLRVPKDSQRNEDKLRVVIDYFDERPTLIHYGLEAPLLQFQRPISSYLNELVKNNLILLEMIEPKASEELIEKFPRDAYMEYDRFPDILVVKTIKRSDF